MFAKRFVLKWSDWTFSKHDKRLVHCNLTAGIMSSAEMHNPSPDEIAQIENLQSN